MDLTADEQVQFDQMNARVAASNITAIQAIIAWLNNPAGAAAGVALCDTALGRLNPSASVVNQINNLRNLLTMSAGNLTTELAPLQTLAAKATSSGAGS